MNYKTWKSGGSVVVTIPLFIRDKLKIQEGTKLNIDIQDDKIIIKKED